MRSRRWRRAASRSAGMRIGSAPPVLAPGAFWGLGLIGLIACLGDGPDHPAGAKRGAGDRRGERAGEEGDQG